jgi:lipopolysaccharide export system protein LptA
MIRHPKQRLGQRNLPNTTLGATVLALGVLLGGAVHAQAPISTETAPAPPAPAAANASTGAPATGSSFGALSKNSGQPIDIESDVLVVHDAKKYATFKGNVKAVQGTTTLRATELDVHYVGGGSDSLTGGTGGQDATAATTDAKAGDAKAGDAKVGSGGALGGDGTQISKIEARGDVIITSDQDQTTTSDWALYDVPAQQVTVGGNVVLMQGKNVLKGDRLVIDLQTGESRFENPGTAAAPGRIRALFMPKDKSGDDKKADDKKTDDKKTDDKKADDKTPSDKTADDKPAPSGSESSENAKAPDKAATSAEPHPDSEAWQLLPGQQP